jgi:hypothetical protein
MAEHQQKSGFFSRDHVHRAGWALLIAALSFLGGWIWKMAVGTAPNDPDRPPIPVTVTVHTASGSPTPEDVRALAEAVRALQQARPNADSQSGADPTKPSFSSHRETVASPKPETRAHAVSAAADAVPARRVAPGSTELGGSKPNEPVASALPRRVVSGGTVVVVGSESDTNPRTPAPSLQAFAGPARWETAAIYGVSGTSCPPAIVRAGEQLSASLTLVDARLRAAASPLHVKVSRRVFSSGSLTVSDRVQHWVEGVNQLLLEPVAEPGEYELSYGFFLRDEVKDPWPKFYSATCRFEARPA